MVVRLDQDRNYPEFLIYHFINEDCFDSFDSNPLPGCMLYEGRATADQVLVVVVVLAVRVHRPAVSACTLY